MNAKYVGILVIAILFAVFIAQNAQVVQVNFLFWSVAASRALVLLFTFVFGLLFGWLTVLIRKKPKLQSAPADANHKGDDS